MCSTPFPRFAPRRPLSHSRRVLLFSVLCLLTVAAPALFLGSPPAGALNLGASGIVYFSQSAPPLRNGFLSYWLTHGQAARWGYPLTGELPEGRLTVQYLERGRLEYNPATGRVGASATGSLLTANRAFAPAAVTRSTNAVLYFPATRHSLRGPFYRYWRTQGGLDSFGAPISEPIREGGRTVQYFQRARFELTAAGGVALGAIGRELLAQRRTVHTLTQAVAPSFQMSFTGLATWFPGNWRRIISLNQSWGNLPYSFHGDGLYAAMPADLHLLGRWGRVTRGGKSIWVQFVDVIDWKDIAQVRREGKVIDLGQESFAQFAPTRAGVLRVTVDVAWPGYKPPGAR